MLPQPADPNNNGDLSSEESPQEILATIQGRIKELRVDWGFIEGEDGIDYFLYCKSMRKDTCSFRSLKVNDLVSFVPTMAAKGPRAERVLRLK